MNGTPSPHYFDNNATTALDPAALEAMLPFLSVQYANPSSPYTFARAPALAVARAREQVAALVGAPPADIVFTSGGTESNNAAVWGALAARPERRHVVTTAVEHVSVLAAAREAERQGVRVTRLPVDGAGRLDLAAARDAITADTALVSVMAANNETGVLFPLRELAELARDAGALFHTDAVQATGKCPFSAYELGADLVSLCAHKMHGPKGVGALYVRAGAPWTPLLRGGAQEQGRRAGTEHVAGIAGFGEAAERALAARDEAMPRLRAWRDRFEAALREHLPRCLVVGADTERLPNTSLVLCADVDTDVWLAHLDLEGFCCSSGSACAAGAHEPSHVLAALGLPAAAGWGSRPVGVLRVSTSRFTTAAEVESLVHAVVGSVKELRATGAIS